MKDIIRLIVKYRFTLFFVALEVVCLSLVVMANDYQRGIFTRESAAFAGGISSVASEVEGYFHLRSENDALVRENVRLRNRLSSMTTAIDSLAWEQDSGGLYAYYQAKVVNGTYNRMKNYLTIDRGSTDGLEREMAVCCADGVVGFIQATSEHFAVVIPLINTQSIVSARIKKNNYYGPLQWDGSDYRYSYLNDIPYHVDVQRGDTIETSNYSSIFPEGVPIGVVEEVEQADVNFLRVKVRLAVDFRKLKHVYVIRDEGREEQEQLETENCHE